MSGGSIFQSTHPVRGATYHGDTGFYGRDISIHAPREGCDRYQRGTCLIAVDISIHAPREGCDHVCGWVTVAMPDFNPRTP